MQYGTQNGLEDFIGVIKSSVADFTWLDAIDVLLVAFVIYFLLKVTSKTRAIQVLKGLGVIILLASLADLAGLTAVSWVLDYVVSAGAVFLVILFQPELRSALEKIGRGKILDLGPAVGDGNREIEEILRAVLNLSIHKTGALMVFEQKTGLRDVMESGTALDARISAELIENIFFVNAPMHDGAMIIKERKVAAAGCFLPLSDNKHIGSELGTRHRAALGISEISDCTTLVVSEETGIISMAREGTLTRYLDSKALRKVLEEIFIEKPTGVRAIGDKLKRKGASK